MKRLVISAMFFLSLLIIGFIFWNPISENIKATNDSQQLPKQTQFLKNIILYESNTSEKNWTLRAVEASANEKWLQWDLDDVSIKFYNQALKTLDVTGDKASVDYENKKINMSNNVRAETASGYEFKTPTVSYDTESKTLSAPELVELKGKSRDEKSIRLTGGSMKVFMENSTVQILGKLIASSFSNTGNKVEFSSRKGELYTNKQTIKLLDEVVIKYMGKQITGPEAIIEYDEDSPSLISKLIINGGATVLDFEKQASSENLEVDFKEKKFVFRGSPQLKQGEDTITGEEIVFLDNGKRVVINNLKANVTEDSIEGIE